MDTLYVRSKALISSGPTPGRRGMAPEVHLSLSRSPSVDMVSIRLSTLATGSPFTLRCRTEARVESFQLFVMFRSRFRSCLAIKRRIDPLGFDDPGGNLVTDPDLLHWPPQMAVGSA